MVAGISAFAVLVMAGVAELLHHQRTARIAGLAFGPGRTPSFIGLIAPFVRTLALSLCMWGLVTLMASDPKVFKAETIPAEDIQHVVIVLDVSPSMNLQDAGPAQDISRSVRVSQLMESFFKRVVMEKVRLSVIAVYTGAKPVVIDTKDVEVVLNILSDLPMYQAFNPGQTDLLAGIKAAVDIASAWRKDSTTLILLTDGDSVPPTGMPALPPSISGSIVVGVGDPRSGKFINGYQSRQDVATLRQMAKRLSGFYHNGNDKHIASKTLDSLMSVEAKEPWEKLGRREYALIAVGLSSLILGMLPALLQNYGTRWKPGVRLPHTSGHSSKAA